MADIAGDATTTATFEGSVEVLATFSGELETLDDTDWIRVTLQDSGVYRFYACTESAGAGSGDSYIRLYDASGNMVEENDNDLEYVASTRNSLILYSPPDGASGTYFLEVSAVGGYVSQYSVLVTIDVNETRLGLGDDTGSGNGSDMVTGDKGDDSILLNPAGIFAFGEQGDDYIVASTNNCRLSGGLGNDSLYGSYGNDRLFGDAGLDFVSGSYGDDLIYGGAGGDILHGGSDNDTIFGGEGADYAEGNDGNDEFHVDNTYDQFLENMGEGTDVVFTSVSYVLLGGQEIEFVETENPLSTTPLNLTGNEFDNSLTGNNGVNVLNGGLGLDVLSGLLGNDVYVLADGGDSVIDSGGIDLVTSTIARSLLAGGLTVIENLTLLGINPINGTGNNANNMLTGNNAINTLDGGLGNDRLVGLAGNDILIGWAGKDTSTGGTGNDIFRFRTTSHSAPGANADVITDFDDYNDDRIDLSLVYGPALKYRHNGAFTAAGQVRINDIAGADVIVEVNTGGSLAADMQIRLTATSVASMAAGDFLL